MDDGCEEYIRQVLEAYRKTPGTMGTVRRADRMLAGQLYQRGISASVIENAFVLAAARRLMRPVDAPPLGTIRSLARGTSSTYAANSQASTTIGKPTSAPLARMMEPQPARLRRG